MVRFKMKWTERLCHFTIEKRHKKLLQSAFDVCKVQVCKITAQDNLGMKLRLSSNLCFEAVTLHFFMLELIFFGPLCVQQGRCTVKCYGYVFTCLAMRAIHLEVGFSLTTDGFVNALPRFISSRCCPHILHSDTGKNFVGAQQELKKALQDLNQTQINAELSKRRI